MRDAGPDARIIRQRMRRDTLLDRFFARDESYRTIGDALDIPAGTIASRISRCLARLKERFVEERPTLARLEKLMSSSAPRPLAGWRSCFSPCSAFRARLALPRS